MKTPLRNFLCAFFAAAAFAAPAAAIEVEQATDAEKALVDSILQKTTPIIEAKKQDQTLATLSYEDLYGSLNGEEKKYLEAIQSLSPDQIGVRTPFLGVVKKEPMLVRLDAQTVRKDGQIHLIETQYLPAEVHQAYEEMMRAMQEDIGLRLLVASGYRSPAYQLYLFVSFMPKHGYSIRKTATLNALPGYSEHGWPERQAIDFVSQEGVDGEESAEAFEKLVEYRWLAANARRFGFVLSYPRDNPAGLSFEPWHWHYEKEGA